MSKKYKTKFCEQWLDLSIHPAWTWLQKVATDYSKGRCSLCNSTFDVSNMGVASIVSHKKGKKHIQIVNTSCNTRLFFKSTSNSQSDTQSAPSTSTSNPESSVHFSRKDGSANVKESGEIPTVIATAAEDSVDNVPSNAKLSSLQQRNIKSFMSNDTVTRAEIL